MYEFTQIMYFNKSLTISDRIIISKDEMARQELWKSYSDSRIYFSCYCRCSDSKLEDRNLHPKIRIKLNFLLKYD